MTKRRWYILASMCLLLIGCRGHHNSFSKKHLAVGHFLRYAAESRKLPSFVNVNIKVPVDVRLHTGYRKPEVLLSGSKHDTALIQTTVKNQTLYVTLGSLKPHVTKKKILNAPVTLDIYMPFIHQFVYRGKGSVVGKNIATREMEAILRNAGSTHFSGNINLRKLKVIGPGYTEINGIKSDNLQIFLYGRPKVQLTGVANISDMLVLGAPKFSFYWLKSPFFKLRAKGSGGVIQIGGMADKLDVELDGNIRFDGRYIRARDTFVKTHGHAVAYVSTAVNQHTLAMDASDIYYYNLPVTNSNFMAKHGAVLDMRSWELQLDQTFTEYNKSA